MAIASKNIHWCNELKKKPPEGESGGQGSHSNLFFIGTNYKSVPLTFGEPLLKFVVRLDYSQALLFLANFKNKIPAAKIFYLTNATIIAVQFEPRRMKMQLDQSTNYSIHGVPDQLAPKDGNKLWRQSSRFRLDHL